jgi:hypothetical protein
MSDRPDTSDDFATRGPADTPTSFIASGLRFLKVRSELLSLETKEASGILSRRLVFILAALGACLLAYLLLLATAAWICNHLLASSAIGAWSVPLTTFLFASFHLAAALLFGAQAKGKFGPPLFEFTRSEWQKDRAWLHQKTSKNESEN